MNFNPILVHGGGKRLTAKLNQLNIESKFVEGLRVSNKNVVKIAEEVFIEFNKEILNEIKNYSVNAKSITSKENNIISVKSISKELGFVGTPYEVNTDILKKILKANEIPIIAPLGLNSDNQVYNVNADDIATFVASSLNARRLIMISDVAGVLNKENNLISEINSAKAKEMISSGEITQGMLVKINNAINVADKVKGTVIIDGRVVHSILYELLSDKGSGTLIRA
jgi:acetylglutamate kinase